MARASAASGPLSPRRKNTQLPSRKRRDETGFGHQLQMPADARLALAEDLGQVLDVQLGLGQQRQDAQARGLARREHRQRLGAGRPEAQS